VSIKPLFTPNAPLSILNFAILSRLGISMLRRIKNIDRKLQQKRSLDKDRQWPINSRWKRDQNTRPLSPSFVLRPTLAALLISLFRTRSLLQRQSGHEQQQDRQEERAQNCRILRVICPCVGRDIAICRGRDGNGEKPELHDDFAKVVWMAGPGEKPPRAEPAFVRWVAAEAVFLHVADAFEHEAETP
jgi:hypothetical protein